MRNDLADQPLFRYIHTMDYLVIGHLTRDLLPIGWQIGGTVAYAGLAARAVGARVRILTCTDAKTLAALPRDGIEVACLDAVKATTFINRHGPGGRTQHILSIALPIGPADVPSDWGKSGVVHVGPVAGECQKGLAQCFSGAFLGLTPQGWMRTWDETGIVRLRQWPEADIWLPRADAVVLSEEDLGYDWELARAYAQQTRLLVVTRASKGCTLFRCGAPNEYPAPAVSKEHDPTGAGDVFAAVFFLACAAGASPDKAAEAANCLAARSVSHSGPPSVTKVDLRACSEVTSTLL